MQLHVAQHTISSLCLKILLYTEEPVRLVRLYIYYGLTTFVLLMINYYSYGNRVMSYTYLNARNCHRQPVLSYDRSSDCK